jgi:hypothetical protein
LKNEKARESNYGINKNKIKKLKRDLNLIFSIGVVSINRAEKMITVEEWLNIGAITGSKCHG